ncbi:PspC domain-containing protein, partial [Listeria monocytogenes]|nr:PspC domain-containing protein [Listeria monocytogenes]
GILLYILAAIIMPTATPESEWE